MRRQSQRWIGLCALVWACGGGADDDELQVPGASSGAESSSGASGGGESSSGASGGVSSSGASGGGASSSGASGGSGGVPSLCEGGAPGEELGELLDLGVPAPAFVSVSDDGRTVVWAIEDAGELLVKIADRTGLNDAFGAPSVLRGDWADARIAVGHVGTKLALLRVDRSGFDAYVRLSRAEAFEVEAVAEPFANINQRGLELAQQDVVYADGSYANGDQVFIHSLIGEGLVDSLVLSSSLIGGPFSNGISFSSAAFLRSTAAGRRRPVAFSADLRSLFYFDEVDQLARVAERGDEGDFASTTSLGARLDARPLPDCGTLLYRAPAAPSSLRAVRLGP